MERRKKEIECFDFPSGNELEEKKDGKKEIECLDFPSGNELAEKKDGKLEQNAWIFRQDRSYMSRKTEK